MEMSLSTNNNACEINDSEFLYNNYYIGVNTIILILASLSLIFQFKYLGDVADLYN
jgi:hypothetical protein